MSILGRLVSAHEIEYAALAQLRSRLPAYLIAASEQYGISIAEPRSWGVVTEFDKWPSSDLPAVILGAEGLTGSPDRDGEGWYAGTWALEVAVTIQSNRGPALRQAGQIYAAAIRGAILQRRSLGLEAITEWIDEAYDDVGVEQRRTTFVAANVFEVTLGRIVSDIEGPGDDQFPDPVPDEWPEVSNTDIETEIKP